MSELAIRGGPPAVSARHDRRWPEILDADREAVMRALNSGRLSGCNAPEVAGLEDDYADYLGVSHALALNSGTAALHCCAAAVGLEAGDEVLVPAFTFMASAMAVCHQGAVPVFCDVEPERFNLDPARVEERITPRTRAIMVVHLHGMPADMDEIVGIAAKHGLEVIEDTAQAHGAIYRGRTVGTIGKCAGTSLQETKNLSGGDGGLFVTDDDLCYAVASRLRIFGEDIFEPAYGRYYWSHGIGWNYRNHELSAALARSQLRRLDDYNSTASGNAERLTARIRGVRGLRAPLEPEDRRSIWYAYRVTLDPDDLGYDGEAIELRDRVMRALDAEGVPVMIWQDFALPAHPVFRRAIRTWHPTHDSEPLREWDPHEYPVSQRIADLSFVIGSPSSPMAVLSTEIVEQYADALEKVISGLESLLEMPYDPIPRAPSTP